MPFILPTGILMRKMKELHTKPIHYRVNFLKNIYYGRLVSYPVVFFVSNFSNLL